MNFTRNKILGLLVLLCFSVLGAQKDGCDEQIRITEKDDGTSSLQTAIVTLSIGSGKSQRFVYLFPYVDHAMPSYFSDLQRELDQRTDSVLYDDLGDYANKWRAAIVRFPSCDRYWRGSTQYAHVEMQELAYQFYEMPPKPRYILADVRNIKTLPLDLYINFLNIPLTEDRCKNELEDRAIEPQKIGKVKISPRLARRKYAEELVQATVPDEDWITNRYDILFETLDAQLKTPNGPKKIAILRESAYIKKIGQRLVDRYNAKLVEIEWKTAFVF